MSQLLTLTLVLVALTWLTPGSQGQGFSFNFGGTSPINVQDVPPGESHNSKVATKYNTGAFGDLGAGVQGNFGAALKTSGVAKADGTYSDEASHPGSHAHHGHSQPQRFFAAPNYAPASYAPANHAPPNYIPANKGYYVYVPSGKYAPAAYAAPASGNYAPASGARPYGYRHYRRRYYAPPPTSAPYGYGRR